MHPLNQHGLVGLIDIKPPGRSSKLSEEQKEALKQLVEAGPDVATDVVRWRCVDLKRVVGQRFGVDVSEVSLGRRPEEAGLHTHQRPTTAPHPGSTGDRHIKKTFQRRS